jgi:Scaffold protein Nfu/NifU N terminal
MGQEITVVSKPSPRRGVVRFETNRNLTGMGHERYASADEATGNRPVDELVRRLFAAGGVDSVHVYSNIITVDLMKGGDGHHLLDVVRELFVHYVPGVLPPTDDELAGATPAGT